MIRVLSQMGEDQGATIWVPCLIPNHILLQRELMWQLGKFERDSEQRVYGISVDCPYNLSITMKPFQNTCPSRCSGYTQADPHAVSFSPIYLFPPLLRMIM